MSEARVHVLAQPGLAVGELLAARASSPGSIVLTGGGSVAPAYAHAAQREPDWSAVSVWWGDERCVPPDDERSNFLLARRSLLDRLATQPQVHRIRGELEPTEAARLYDAELAGVELDLLLLGVGADGHVASLFPGSPQLAVRDARVTWGEAGLEPFVTRVTMTLPTLLRARRIVVLAVGAAKTAALARAFGPEPDRSLPASLLRDADAPLELYCDPAAAGGLASTA